MSKPLPVHCKAKLSQFEYTTSYEIGLQYKPKISYICERIERKIPNNLKLNDPLIHREGYKTHNDKVFDVKFKFEVEEAFRKPPSFKAPFQKTFEEKNLVTNYPRELYFGKGNSEYRRTYIKKQEKGSDIFETPAEIAFCESRGLGRDEQTPIPPGEPSLMKLIDPYLSETQYNFTSYSPKKQTDLVGAKDIITFYDANNFPRVRGYGPKNKALLGPIFSPQLHIFDKVHFKKPIIDCVHRRYLPFVPRRGMQTESQEKFKTPINDLITKTRDNLTFIAIPKASPWETMAGPYMYCTENCHIGSFWPILGTINQGKALHLKP